MAAEDVGKFFLDFLNVEVLRKQMNDNNYPRLLTGDEYKAIKGKGGIDLAVLQEVINKHWHEAVDVWGFVVIDDILRKSNGQRTQPK